MLETIETHSHTLAHTLHNEIEFMPSRWDFIDVFFSQSWNAIFVEKANKLWCFLLSETSEYKQWMMHAYIHTHMTTHRQKWKSINREKKQPNGEKSQVQPTTTTTTTRCRGCLRCRRLTLYARIIQKVAGGIFFSSLFPLLFFRLTCFSGRKQQLSFRATA